MQFHSFVPTADIDDIDPDAVYADKFVVDSGGIDLFADGQIVVSASFDGLDRNAVALAVLGTDTGEVPTHSEYEIILGNAQLLDDGQLEIMAHAVLSVLAERGEAK